MEANPWSLSRHRDVVQLNTKTMVGPEISKKVGVTGSS